MDDELRIYRSTRRNLKLLIWSLILSIGLFSLTFLYAQSTIAFDAYAIVVWIPLDIIAIWMVLRVFIATVALLSSSPRIIFGSQRITFSFPLVRTFNISLDETKLIYR